jgi:hypothetical protein
MRATSPHKVKWNSSDETTLAVVRDFSTFENVAAGSSSPASTTRTSTRTSRFAGGNGGGTAGEASLLPEIIGMAEASGDACAVFVTRRSLP